MATCCRHDEESLTGRSRQRRNGCFPSRTRKTALLVLIDLSIVSLLLYAFRPLITLLYLNEELFRPTIVLSDLAPFNAWKDSGLEQTIPRILHQTSPTDDIPEKWINSQQSCKTVYSDFQYKLWTDESARDFLSTNYAWFVETWDQYAFPIQRADSIRYLVLHHYGGIYLDMDTWCNQSFPVSRIAPNAGGHFALFKSTTPTGVTNDFMITSAKHPVYTAAIESLISFNTLTRVWALWQPYCAIMLAAGPMFLTLVVKDYLLGETSSAASTIGIIDSTTLTPYITDLESASWHRRDAQVFMWLGQRPWVWFILGTAGLFAILYAFNFALIELYNLICRGLRPNPGSDKIVKIT